MSSNYEILGRPVTFGSGRTALNGLLKSAMTERLCTYDDANLDECGKPNPEYVTLYKKWGEGGMGIIVLGNIPVCRTALESKGNAIIDKDNPWDPVTAFKPAIAAAKAHGSIVIGQLTHAGRQTTSDVNPRRYNFLNPEDVLPVSLTETTLDPVSSSDTQNPSARGLNFAPARAMTVKEIKDVVERFGYGAEVLYKAGADGAQLHSAHGYLLSQFLSPKVNQRTDDYGGPLENRSRIIFEIIANIRKRVPDPKFIVSIKYNSHDYIEGGFSQEDSQKMAVMMEEAGVDLIELSGGTYESNAFQHKSESMRRREAFFVEFAERIRPHLTKKSKLCVTGGFRSSSAMVACLRSNVCDIIGLGRPLCSEPDLCAKLVSGRVAAAQENKVDPTLQIRAAYIQETRLGKGLEPLDFSQEYGVKVVTARLVGNEDVSCLNEEAKHALSASVVNSRVSVRSVNSRL